MVTFCSLVLGLSTVIALSRVCSNFLVVALERRKVLAGLRELALLHTLTHVPVHEGALAVHEVELVREGGPGLGDRGGVGEHADGAVDLGEVSVRHHLWWLVADADLEASRAPVDELDGALGLEGGDGLLDIDWDDIAAVEEAGGHVLAVAWVALHHLAVWLEAGHADFLHAVGFVSGLGCRDDWCVGDQREVDAWVWHQVGLELVEIDVQRSIEAEGGSNTGDDLGDETVEVLVVRTLEAEVATTNVVDGIIVDHEGAVAVLESGVSREDGVVRLNNGCGDLRGWIDTELQLALLAVVDRETLHQQSTEARTGTSTEAVEDEEALETRAIVRNTPNLVEHLVDELFADSVVAASVVVRGILLASDHLLGMEEATVGAGADLVDDIRLEIAVDGARNVLAVAYDEMSEREMYSMCLAGGHTGLGEEGGETMVIVGALALLGEIPVRLCTMSVYTPHAMPSSNDLT